MRCLRPLLATLLLVSCAADAPAQFFPGPVYGPGVSVLVPNGIGFQYRGRRLSVSGFFNTGYSIGVLPAPGFVGPFGPGPIGPGPFGPLPAVPIYTLPTAGYVDTRVTYQVIAPTVVLAPRPGIGIPAEEADLSGVDLDVAPSPLLLEERRRAPRGELKPKWDPPIEPKPKPDKGDLPKAKPKPVEELSFLDEGKLAFRDGEFALAVFHFRQAAAAKPGDAVPLFYLAQALVATSKFRDAVATIEKTLKLDPDLPLKPYRPKIELFKGAEPEFARQRKVLADLIAEHPKNGTFLFLDGYLDWYEGDRAAARKTFILARGLLADPWFVDRFLKAPDVLVLAP